MLTRISDLTDSQRDEVRRMVKDQADFRIRDWENPDSPQSVYAVDERLTFIGMCSWSGETFCAQPYL